MTSTLQHSLDSSDSRLGLYQHAPISEGDFRILTLEAGKLSDVLRGSLIHANIEEYKQEVEEPLVNQTNYGALSQPGYDALSYYWGDGAKPCQITLDGKPFLIGQNLYNALRRLRSRSRDRKLWADAICVNQDNKSEKSSQVMRMTDIYQNALQTIVWLGEDSGAKEGYKIFRFLKWCKWITKNCKTTPRDDISDDRLRQIVDDFLSIESAKSIGRGNTSHFEHLLRFYNRALPLMNKAPHITLSMMEALLDRPWFSRRWVVQETALSRGFGRFLCGNQILEWGCLRDVFAHCAYNLPSSLSKMPASNLLNTIIEAGFEVNDFLYNFYELQTMDKYHDFEGKDDRDRLAAFNYLWPKSERFYTDYEISVEANYIAFATFRLSFKLQSPEGILWCAGLHVQRSENTPEPLPSWVPDWRTIPVELSLEDQDFSFSIVSFRDRQRCRFQVLPGQTLIVTGDLLSDHFTNYETDRIGLLMNMEMIDVVPWHAEVGITILRKLEAGGDAWRVESSFSMKTLEFERFTHIQVRDETHEFTEIKIRIQ